MSKSEKTSKNVAINVSNLTKQYNGLKAVDNISFSVQKGEIFAFLGPNGAGKSTTIKMLTTLLVPTEGKMQVNNFNPIIDQDRVRQSFGIVFQDPSLDEELTAWENMEYHGVLYGIEKGVRCKRIKELLIMMELWDRRKDFVKKFSGGMKRRLEIARGFLHDPKILFLDEPTLGLDPQTRSKIWDHIKHLNRNKKITIFFTTHYMEEAEKMAQKIAIIDNGKIVAQGTLSKLITQTKTKSLEGAFLKLTGKTIREASVSGFDRMRMRVNQMRRRH